MNIRAAILVLATFVATHAVAADYIVVLTNGTKYVATEKWTVQNGKAIIKLKTGQSLQLDPTLIDTAKSEAATKNPMGNLTVLDAGTTPTATPQTKQAPSLGDVTKIRRQQNTPPPVPAGSNKQPARGSAPLPPLETGAGVGNDVLSKFTAAYENVGLYEYTVTSSAPHTVRTEVTADNEEKVFNAISATSFVMTRSPAVTGTRIDLVELFMKTTNGGAAGRFLMSRDDADALDKKQITRENYFIAKVVF